MPSTDFIFTTLTTIGFVLAQDTSTTTRNYTSEINIGKFISIPLIFFIILLSCLLPHLLIKLKNGASTAIAFATCLSGGALLGIGLMHILPHANEYWSIWLTPAGCGGDHSGHNHNFVKPDYTTEITISDQEMENDTTISKSIRLLSLQMKRDLEVNNSFLSSSSLSSSFNHTIFPSSSTSSMSPTQSIEPINPIVLVPTPVAPSTVKCPEGHAFPWAELCCGLIIMLLMAAESFLHTFLAGRGPNAVHLHVHDDGEACGGHDHHHHHHHHGHDHSKDDSDHHQHRHKNDNHNDTNDASTCNDNCPEQIIELAPICDSIDCATSPPQQGNNGECCTPVPAPAAQNNSSQDDSNTSPLPESNQVVVDDSNQPGEGNDDQGLDEHGKAIQHILEDGDVDEHGNPLSLEQRERLRFRRTVDAYISALAISLHCIFNGLSLGVYSASTSSDVSSFWSLFAVTVAHKIVDGFAVGIPLLRANLSKVTTLVIAILVSLSTPIGIIIGYSASNIKSDGRYLAQAILMSLSSGSFFYIALLEMIPNGVKGKDWVPLKWLLVCIGFALSATIAKWA